ncbi:MAG: cyclic nucleotide-binding domain-containing protein [Deltaproteobacteria bacterium]|nr:cyclic nucleotide-binding domain-containing protein [Deltaproteobacteria bacterium]
MDAWQTRTPLEGDMAAMAFVESSILFQGLDAAQLAEVYRAGAVVVYGPGKVIFEEGANDDLLFLIVEGSVSVRKVHDNRKVELATLEREAIFGEMSVLAKRQRSATVMTRTEVRLIALPGDTMRSMADMLPKFGRKLAGLMAGRTKDTDKKLGG